MAAVRALTATLGQTYVAHLTDGRTLVGKFAAIDKQGNLVLDQALEYLEYDDELDEQDDKGRQVGLVLIPRDWWKAIKRELTAAEALDLGYADEVDAGGNCKTV